ncbi:MAG: 3-hydroxyacyl-ACP dehydratase FabZ, partial [Verrucomicrobiota bacterium]
KKRALEAAEYLLPPPPSPTPPLLIAARAGSTEAMKVLIAAGAKPDAKAQDGLTLLLAAAGSGNLEALKYALTLVPDINALAQGGKSIMHMALANRTAPAADTEAIITYLADKGTALGAMDIHTIMKFLPHRYPFLMVDRVLSIEGNKIVGIKNVSINEPHFLGHFPGHPIMPGVLQLEAMAQVAGIAMLKKAENAGQIAYFMSAENVKWRKPVLPGDVLTIEVELTKSRGKIGKARGVCKVQGEPVSEADVTFMLMAP